MNSPQLLEQNMREIAVDKIGSCTLPCGLSHDLLISPYIVAEEGYCLAVRALDDKEVYNTMECTDASFATLRKGDIIVGALGERRALKGYSGRIPHHIEVGDILNVLNKGGMIGLCTSDHPDVGPALNVEVLGGVVKTDGEYPRHATIQDSAIDPVYSLTESAPLISISGTAMNTGKTYAAVRIVEQLTKRGYSVAAAKLTGAALMRDVRKMKDHGAIDCASFTEAGIVSSTNKEMEPIAKGLIAHVNTSNPDAIVLEFGDGFVGYYGVGDLLKDKEIQRFTHAHVVAATDLAGAWAADQLVRNEYRLPITTFIGPVTDNDVGKHFIQNEFGVPALNARQDAEELGDLMVEKLEEPPTTRDLAGGDHFDGN